MKTRFHWPSGTPHLGQITSPLFRWQRQAKLILAGGRWSAQLGPRTRRSLRWLAVDGVLANIGEAIFGAYQSIYLAALGATRGEIGLLSSLMNLALPAAMIPGGRLATKARRLKPLVVLPGLLGRVLLLLLILLPLWLSPGPTLVFVSIALIVGRSLIANLMLPAWTTLISDIVPAQWRGRYFSTRNILMGVGGLVGLLLVGQLIDHHPGIGGYQLALTVALLTGLGSVYAFGQIEEPSRPAAAAQSEVAPVPLRQLLQGQGRFVAYCTIAALWNLTVQISGPFFNIFLAEEAHASASVIALTAATSTLASLPGQRVFGPLSDRKGSVWVQRLTGFGIPIVPALWGLITQPWQAFPLQLLAGFLWAGYNLASFNLLLELTPAESRPQFVAVYQAAVGIGLAAGAAVGGWIAQVWGYRPVFWVSGVGRLVIAVAFSVLIAGINPLRARRAQHPR
ncbi:MAG TPA: MFS transporter [Anaerolineae bacterium]|nr:MFS transporter [Anaerolineae bacterium]